MSVEKNKIHVARHIDLPRDLADMVPTREEACITGEGGRVDNKCPREKTPSRSGFPPLRLWIQVNNVRLFLFFSFKFLNTAPSKSRNSPSPRQTTLSTGVLSCSNFPVSSYSLSPRSLFFFTQFSTEGPSHISTLSA